MRTSPILLFTVKQPFSLFISILWSKLREEDSKLEFRLPLEIDDTDCILWQFKLLLKLPRRSDFQLQQKLYSVIFMDQKNQLLESDEHHLNVKTFHPPGSNLHNQNISTNDPFFLCTLNRSDLTNVQIVEVLEFNFCNSQRPLESVL